MSRGTTIVDLLVGACAAYAARHFNNIMDMLLLVFGFGHAPLGALVPASILVLNLI